MFLLKIYYKLKTILKFRQFRKNAIIYDSLIVGHNSSCVSNYKENITIEKNCEIHGRLFSNGNGKISIGRYTTIRSDTIISATDNIIIGDHVIISNNVRIYDNNSHPTDPEFRIKMCESGFNSELWKAELAKKASVSIGDNVWIGEKAVILKGVKIGKGSIIGTQSIVTKSIPEYVVAAGNPAVIVKKIKNQI